MAINPVNDTIYMSAAVGTANSLYTLNPATAAATLVGAIAPVALPVALAMNCAGELYAHDLGADTILRVNPATGATTTVGPTRVDSNFAQGMDFDNDTSKIKNPP